MYLDDKFTAGVCQAWVNAMQDAMDEASEEHGMPGAPEKKEEASAAIRVILGNEFVGELGLYRPGADEVHYLRTGGDALLRRRFVDGGVIEKLLGHVSWRFLLRRATFGSLDHLYSFSRNNRHRWTKW